MKTFIAAGIATICLSSILTYSTPWYTTTENLLFKAKNLSNKTPNIDKKEISFGAVSQRNLENKGKNTYKTRSFEIIQKRIPLTEKRKELTRQYTLMHYGIDSVYMTSPRVIVIHWTGGGTIQSVYNYFYSDTIQRGSWHEKYGEVNVSSQFLVDKDGTIYQLFDDTFIARHCIGMNFHAIGIENIGGANGIDDLTDLQLAANISLIKYLMAKYPSIDLVIGHYEYRNYEGTQYFLELLPDYRNVKSDPGERFMAAIRKSL